MRNGGPVCRLRIGDQRLEVGASSTSRLSSAVRDVPDRRLPLEVEQWQRHTRPAPACAAATTAAPRAGPRSAGRAAPRCCRPGSPPRRRATQPIAYRATPARSARSRSRDHEQRTPAEISDDRPAAPRTRTARSRPRETRPPAPARAAREAITTRCPAAPLSRAVPRRTRRPPAPTPASAANSGVDRARQRRRSPPARPRSRCAGAGARAPSRVAGNRPKANVSRPVNRLVPVAPPNQSAPSHASGPKRRWTSDSNSAALARRSRSRRPAAASAARRAGGNSTL